MAQDEDDDDKLPPLGEGTEKFLEDTKKGKPRSFLLICKGAKVSYLAVKKKPVKSTELSEAKKQGYKGQGYFGVITGQSLNLVFNLARSDGYDKEPVKDKALKDFLEEQVGLKAKPTFAIVDSPPTIPFDEEDLANPLVARFMAMGQSISDAIDAQPDRESDLLSRVTAIRGLLQDGNFNAAGPKIDELAALLAGRQVPPAQPVPPAPPVPPSQSTASATPSPAPSQPDSEMARFTSRLKAIKPSIDAAIAAKDARGDEIKLRVSEAAMFARKQEFAEANRLLDDVEQRLKPAEVGAASDPGALFNERFKALLPDIKAAVGTPAGDEAKLKASEAGVFARKKDFVQANALLDQAQAALRSPQITNLEGSWAKALADLEPAYLQGLRDFPVDASKLRAVMDFAQGKAETGAYPAAIAALQKLAEVLRGKQTAATVTPTKNVVDPEKSLMARLNALTPRIKEFATAADAAGLAAGADLDAKKAALAPRNRLLTLVRDCKGMFGKNDEQAEAMLAEIEEILKKGQHGSPPTSETPSEPAEASAETLDPLEIWRDAKESADDQLNKFVRELKKSGDDYLVKIAEGGVHGFVEGPSRVFVTLQAALMDFGRSSGEAREKIRLKVLDAVKTYRTFLGESEFLEVCDTNELCGPLTIRKTLSTALEQIDRALA